MTTPEPSTLSEQEFDALETKVKADCNEHVNGYCHTVACLKRGGWEKGCNPANFTPSCEAKQILRLIAQARAARPSPWQPIETAPKDTSILVSDGVDVWETHLGNLPYTSATTWQPLPAPPAQDGGLT